MLSHERDDVCIRYVAAPGSIAGGRPEDGPEAIRLPRGPNVRAIQQRLDVPEGMAGCEGSRQDRRVRDDLQVRHEGWPEEVDKLGAVGQALDERQGRLVVGIGRVRCVDQDVRVDRRAHASSSARRTASGSSRSTSGRPRSAADHSNAGAGSSAGSETARASNSDATWPMLLPSRELRRRSSRRTDGSRSIVVRAMMRDVH